MFIKHRKQKRVGQNLCIPNRLPIIVLCYTLFGLTFKKLFTLLKLKVFVMAEFIKIYPENPNPKAIKQVVDVLKRGGLIIYPTDTVYGLGYDITNTKALERVAQIKGVKLEKANFSF